MSEVIELQADDWESEVLKADGPVVVDFWHHMCGWCQKLNPIFAQLPEQFENVKFVKINILESEENRQAAMDSGVLGTPTIKVFCDGRDIGEIVGFRPLTRLVKDLGEILANKDECLGQSTPLE
jgi:thioredoxin 1